MRAPFLVASCLMAPCLLGCGDCDRLPLGSLDACIEACEAGSGMACARVGTAIETRPGADLQASAAYFSEACEFARGEQWLCSISDPGPLDAARLGALESRCEAGEPVACHALRRREPVTVAMPSPTRALAPPAPPVSVRLLPDGGLLVAGEPCEAEELAERQWGSRTRVVISAPRTTPHGRLMEVIDLLRAAGVTRYVLNIDPEELEL